MVAPDCDAPSHDRLTLGAAYATADIADNLTNTNKLRKFLQAQLPALHARQHHMLSTYID
jgi:hypothetical protein